jgi:hypothetical protein
MLSVQHGLGVGDGGEDDMTAEASGGPGGRVFVSYRRGDASYPAAWLFDQLTSRFGSDRVFMDVDSIEPQISGGRAVAVL